MDLERTLSTAGEYRKNHRFDDAIQLLGQLKAHFPQDARIYFQLGTIALESQQPAQACNELQHAVQLVPDDPQAWKFLGDAWRDRGDLSRAIEAYSKALELDDNYFQAHANLGNIYYRQDNPEGAARHYLRAVELQPEIAALHDLVGLALKGKGSQSGALLAFRQALQLDPGFATASYNLGNLYFELGRYADALTLYSSALDKLGDSLPVNMAYIQTLMKMGDLDLAKQRLARFAHDNSDDFLLELTRAILAQEEGLPDEACDRLGQVLARDDLPAFARVVVSTQLANAEESSGNYAQAFRIYSAMNAGKESVYDRQAILEKIEDIERTAPVAGNVARAHPVQLGVMPVFIIGLPRSGKSLTELLLATHGQFASLDEMLSFRRFMENRTPGVVSNSDYSESIRSMSDAELDQLAQDYISSASDYLLGEPARNVQTTRFITSTNPTNGYELDLIHRVFPRAPIIVVTRGTLDHCLDCYCKQFTSRKHDYSNSLEDLAFHYRHYQRLLTCWRDVARIPMLQMTYEELLEDPLAMRAKLLDFIDPSLKMTMNEDIPREFPAPGTGVDRGQRFSAELKPLKDQLANP